MEAANRSTVREFILLGFKDLGDLRGLLFMLFAIIYFSTLVCNLGIVVLIRIDCRLHTPMYLFLSNLSFVDLCYSSVTTPKVLVNMLSEYKSITFLGCAVQLFFAGGFGSVDCFLLSVMAYDRYVAICYPLRYTILMTKKMCIQLVSSCYLSGALHSLIQTSCTFRLSFCNSNEINHFYCDIPPLLTLSCTDTFANELVLFSIGGLSILGSFLSILISYVFIAMAILKIHSVDGRHRAFSTCASHFTAVILFYATVSFVYLRPSSNYSLDRDRIASVFYMMVIPLLNPLVYCFRNKEVKGALRRTIAGKNLCL